MYILEFRLKILQRAEILNVGKTKIYNILKLIYFQYSIKILKQFSSTQYNIIITIIIIIFSIMEH